MRSSLDTSSSHAQGAVFQCKTGRAKAGGGRGQVGVSGLRSRRVNGLGNAVLCVLVEGGRRQKQGGSAAVASSAAAGWPGAVKVRCR